MHINEKFIALHKSLMALTHNNEFIKLNRPSKLKKLLPLCAKQLGVARVSVWRLEETNKRIQCEYLNTDQDDHRDKPFMLLQHNCPHYFKAITKNKLITVENALQDPRTAELANAYLEPQGIKSLMSAPLFISDKLHGLLHIEQTTAIKTWDIADMSYATAVADTITFINEHESWLATKEALELLEQRDSLTGLENRRFFQQRLEKDLQDSDQPSRLRALVLLGLDFFTHLNDQYGLRAADHVLRVLSDRFQTLSQTSNVRLSRVGGDTFAFWLADISDEKQLKKLLNAIQSLSKKPISLSQSKSIEVSASLGVFTYPQEDIAIKNPIRAAETAMARAKKQSKGSTEYFSIDWMKQLRARRSQEEQLLEAFNNNQLKAHYQPILSGETGEFVGLEALVRWQHPQKGLITPDLFLPLATKLGLMPRLGKFMLRQACKDIQTLRQSGIKIQWMSVNLSAEQLYNLHLAQEVENALKEFDIPNNIIELEIVEELISQDSELVQSQLNAIAKLGVSLSIDDFGTGFSSLSRLKHLPVSKLKIDKSFVDGLPDSEDDQCIVRSIIGLARGMNLSVVAEGVETSPQAQWLIERGCDFLQGYFYSKPVEFDKLKEILCEKTNKQNPIKGTYHIETRGNMLLIQVKGSWDTALALEFFDTIHQHLKSMKKQAWGTLLDTREWNPTSLKVQKETTGKIQQLIKKGLRCSAYIVNDSELVKFQLEKMAPSFNDYKRKYFNNKDSAAQWLSKEGFEIT